MFFFFFFTISPHIVKKYSVEQQQSPFIFFFSLAVAAPRNRFFCRSSRKHSTHLVTFHKGDICPSFHHLLMSSTPSSPGAGLSSVDCGAGGGLLVPGPELLERLHLVVPPVAVLGGCAPLLPALLTHLRHNKRLWMS